MTVKEQLEGNLLEAIESAGGTYSAPTSSTSGNDFIPNDDNAVKNCMAVHESSLGEFAEWLGKNKWQRSPYPGFTGVWYKNDPYQTVKIDSPEYDSWRQWECSNPKFDYNIHFKPAHANAADLCINCTLHETSESVLKRLKQPSILSPLKTQ
jgi:hypothetical protein